VLLPLPLPLQVVSITAVVMGDKSLSAVAWRGAARELRGITRELLWVGRGETRHGYGRQGNRRIGPESAFSLLARV